MRPSFGSRPATSRRLHSVLQNTEWHVNPFGPAHGTARICSDHRYRFAVRFSCGFSACQSRTTCDVPNPGLVLWSFARHRPRQGRDHPRRRQHSGGLGRIAALPPPGQRHGRHRGLPRRAPGRARLRRGGAQARASHCPATTGADSERPEDCRAVHPRAPDRARCDALHTVWNDQEVQACATCCAKKACSHHHPPPIGLQTS